MKERRKAVSEPVVTAPETVESLSDVDKGLLDNTKLKRELALANVKSALSQSENAELSHNNVILQLAIKYKLSEGDIITEDGIIKRTNQS